MARSLCRCSQREECTTDTPRTALSRDKVLEAALRLIDEHGLAALTMRRLAGDLGIEAMSLYYHVRNKADLLDGVTARVFEMVAVPDPMLPWNERLTAMGTDAYRAFRAHPQIVQAISVQYAEPRSRGALRMIDALLAAMLDAGLTEEGAARGYCTLFEMIFASVRKSSSVPTEAALQNAKESAEWYRKHAVADDYPNLHRVLPALLSLDCSDDFEAELARFVHGLPTDQELAAEPV